MSPAVKMDLEADMDINEDILPSTSKDLDGKGDEEGFTWDQLIAEEGEPEVVII